MFGWFKRISQRESPAPVRPYDERLSENRIAACPPPFDGFAYRRELQLPGIVHFGIGAFHRAHQAVYVDKAMSAGERHWAIIGVSLRSANVAAQLNPQDGLYTVAVRSAAETEYRLIGAIKQVLVASYQAESIKESIAYPTVKIVSFTITEKGYCRDRDGNLDFDLATDASVYRFLKDGLALRRELGLPGLTLLSCDNLPDNGAQLRRLLNQYLTTHDPALAAWVDAHCTFPNSMVDRIVPATTQADKLAAQDAMGWGELLWDEAHVVTEPFCQWVIEDRFAGPRPRWEDHGVQIVADVAPYETAKLRMLNGAHSLLAYCGLDRGHEFVHQAIADPELRALAGQLMRDEAAPTIAAAAGQDLAAYAAALVARFENPALQHRLAQIAMDGSQKLPQRWLATLAARQASGLASPAIMRGLAAWLRHVRGDRRAVDDPLAMPLAAAWQQGDTGQAIRAILGPGGLVTGPWQPQEADLATLTALVDGEQA